MIGSRIATAFRDASWLDARRAQAYAAILVAMYAVTAVVYLALSEPPLNPVGTALGTDFGSFWTASKLALAGRAAEAWSIPAHQAAQRDLFGESAGYAAFFYPPPFLLLCLPLALAPYTLSLGVWLAVTGAGWWAAARAWLGRGAVLPLLAFPATLINLGHGQNGFVTAGLFGAAALLIRRRPYLGGALFGLLVIKPHLAMLVPVFLVFTGNWRAFAAAALSAAAACLMSWIVFGPEAWRAFLDSAPLAHQTLEQGGVGFGKMQSVFAGARLLGAPLWVAWPMQIAAIAAAVVALWRVRRHDDLMAQGAALACATLVATPFLLGYDLTLLAFPLAWLFVQARTGGWLPWERIIAATAFALPLFSRQLATAVHIPIAPVVLFALMACVLRRAGRPLLGG